MKNILLIAAVASLTLASCKKDRTCTCVVTPVSSTDNGVTQPLLISSYSVTNKLTKVTKKGAHCRSGESTQTRTSTSGGTTHTYVDVSKVDCKLS